MKKTVLLSLAIFLSLPSAARAAGWEKWYVTNDGTQQYIDRSTVKRNENIVVFKLRTDLAKPIYLNPLNTIYSSIADIEVDCKLSKWRQLTLTNYLKPNLGHAGGVAPKTSDADDKSWRALQAGSTAIKPFLSLCS